MTQLTIYDLLNNLEEFLDEKVRESQSVDVSTDDEECTDCCTPTDVDDLTTISADDIFEALAYNVLNVTDAGESQDDVLKATEAFCRFLSTVR